MVQALQLDVYLVVLKKEDWHDSPSLEGIVPDMEECEGPHPHLQLVDQQQEDVDRKEYLQYKDHDDLLSNPEEVRLDQRYCDFTQWGSPGKPQCEAR